LLDLIVASYAAGAQRLMDRHIRHVRGIWAEDRGRQAES